MKCRGDTENIDPKWLEQKIIDYVIKMFCGIKKSRFMKEQEAKGLLSNLGIKTPLSKIPLLNVLSVKMNEIVNKILLVGVNLCQKCI